jgi:hypothetical protein
MSRRYLLVASSAASVGYLVGWLAGSNVLKMAEGRRLGRPEPRTALSGHTESLEPRTAPQNGAERIPTQRDDEPCPVTLGSLTCPLKGPHTSHPFQSGTWAPDRKDDTDEGIE